MKEKYSSDNEKLKIFLSTENYITRLIKKRPLAFLNKEDFFLLRDGITTEKNGVHDFNDSSEDYISYDEMEISAFLGLSGPVNFINDGNRKNNCQEKYDGKTDDKKIVNGVLTGLVGARFEKENVMEFKYIIINENCTTENGYGKNPKQNSILDMWAEFYTDVLPKKDDGKPYFPSFEEVNGVGDQFTKFKTDNDIEVIDYGGPITYFNKKVYGHTMKIRLLTYFNDVENRCNEDKKINGARCYVTGLGLGAWIYNNNTIQETKYYKVIKDILDNNTFQNIKEIVLNVTNIEYFKNAFPDSEINEIDDDTQDGSLYKYKDISIRVKDISIKLVSYINPSKQWEDDLHLFEMYAWDSNSYPGNEYYLDMKKASGDPAAICSCDAVYYHNAYANPNIQGQYAKIYCKHKTVESGEPVIEEKPDYDSYLKKFESICFDVNYEILDIDSNLLGNYNVEETKLYELKDDNKNTESIVWGINKSTTESDNNKLIAEKTLEIINGNKDIYLKAFNLSDDSKKLILENITNDNIIKYNFIIPILFLNKKNVKILSNEQTNNILEVFKDDLECNSDFFLCRFFLNGSLIKYIYNNNGNVLQDAIISIFLIIIVDIAMDIVPYLKFVIKNYKPNQIKFIANDIKIDILNKLDLPFYASDEFEEKKGALIFDLTDEDIEKIVDEEKKTIIKNYIKQLEEQHAKSNNNTSNGLVYPDIIDADNSFLKLKLVEFNFTEEVFKKYKTEQLKFLNSITSKLTIDKAYKDKLTGYINFLNTPATTMQTIKDKLYEFEKDDILLKLFQKNNDNYNKFISLSILLYNLKYDEDKQKYTEIINIIWDQQNDNCKLILAYIIYILIKRRNPKKFKNYQNISKTEKDYNNKYLDQYLHRVNLINHLLYTNICENNTKLDTNITKIINSFLNSNNELKDILNLFIDFILCSKDPIFITNDDKQEFIEKLKTAKEKNYVNTFISSLPHISVSNTTRGRGTSIGRGTNSGAKRGTKRGTNRGTNRGANRGAKRGTNRGGGGITGTRNNHAGGSKNNKSLRKLLLNLSQRRKLYEITKKNIKPIKNIHKSKLTKSKLLKSSKLTKTKYTR
jgi:hypothetical protein